MTAARTAVAKVSAPRLFGVVARERLFSRLDENRGRPMIWVEGPPGAGKTTLMASYLETRGIPVLWYQVDSGDADPANLFHYLALGTAALVAPDALALPRLAPEHLSDLTAFSRTFFREMFVHLPRGAVVVLDNYQEVSVTAPLHEIIHAAVGAVPPESSLIGISRVEPPGSFSRLSAKGELYGLRWDKLQLTLEETRAICAFREVRDEWLVRALHRQSEGWAAGITLMLERLGQTDTGTRELTTDTRESVFNYFATLLFEHATESARHTLISIAFMPHVNAAMAEALTDNTEAGTLLDDLYRRHLFTDRRPGLQPVYQFHALFRDFLQRRAIDTLEVSELERMKSLSAQILEANGEFEHAMELRITARNWDEATALILQQASALLKSGRWQTLERWISALPSDYGEREPRLLYWLGVAQVQSEPERGLTTLLRARELFRPSADREGRLLCLSSLLQVVQMGHFGLSMADPWLGEVLEEIDSPDAVVSPELELPIWSGIVASMLFLRPWHALAASARQRVQQLISRETDPTAALSAAAAVLVSDTTTGGLDAADELVALVEPLAGRAGASPSASTWFFYGVAYLRFVQARYEESLQYFEAAIRAASASGLKETLSDIFLYRFMVEYRVCGWSIAHATLQQAEKQCVSKRPTSVALLRIYQARRAHCHDRWEEAGVLALQSIEAVDRTGAPQFQMSYGLFAAEILIGAGRSREARPLLTRSRQICERSPMLDCWRAAATFCEAFLAWSEGSQTARALLGEALRLAKEGSRKYYFRYFECCMPPLFVLALEEGIEPELVQQLIRMFRLKAPLGAPDLWPRPVRIWTLGRFEVHVNDRPLEFSRKVPKKTLALLKALIAYGAKDVPDQWLCDSLWGDEEADAARQVLGVTVLRLRKLLGSDDAVGQLGGKVWLDRSMCWVDAWRMEALLADAPNAVAAGRALDLYAGAFLSQDEDEPWSVVMRERLRGKFIHALATHGAVLERGGGVDEAVGLYQRGIDADVVVEAFHRGLMRCYRRSGRFTEAISAYRRLRQTLSVVLGVAPSVESEALHQEILRELAAFPVVPAPARDTPKRRAVGSR